MFDTGAFTGAIAIIQAYIALAAECFDVLHQVVSKGVVVIDDHDAFFHGRKRCICVLLGQRLRARRSALSGKSFSVDGGRVTQVLLSADLKLADAEAGR